MTASLKRLRLVVVDDHPLLRQGVVSTLSAEPDFDVVGEGASAEQAVGLARKHRPDVILLDIDMPGSGLQAARDILAELPATRVVMLTVSEQEDDLDTAFKAGARGYILKGIAGRELVQILRRVWSGEPYAPASLAASLLAGLARPEAGGEAEPSALESLSEREREILELIGAGFSNKEIGHQLALSEKTVKHYVTSLFQKLGVRNRVEAALIAHREAAGGTDRPPAGPPPEPTKIRNLAHYRPGGPPRRRAGGC